MRRRITIVTAVVAVLAVFASVTGLVWKPWENGSSSQQVEHGVTVVLPGGLHAADFGLAAHSVAISPAVAARQGLRVVGQPLEFTSTRSIPPGTQLRFREPKHLKPPAPGMKQAVFEAYFDRATQRWVPEPSTYNAPTGLVVATVSHFSVHAVVEWSWDQMKALLTGALKSVFGPWLDHLTPPRCGSEHGVSMYQMQGDDKTVPSCHDASIVSLPTASDPGSANITMRLGDARHYPLDVISPKGSVIHSGNPGDPAWQVGAAITKAVSLDAGKRMALLPADSLMSVQFPTTQAPFDTIKERSQIDGTAFYVGVLVMALDEMAKVCGLDVDQTLPLLVKEMDTADLTVQTFRELEDPSLSLQEVQDLGKLAMDALLTVVEHGPLAVVDAVKLAINILDALWTNVHELLDTVEGNAFHLWTFGTHGNTWAQPLPGIEQTDWESVEIPGDWFDAQQSQIQLAAGNNWDVTTSHGPVSVVAASGHPVYGDLFGNRQTVGAIMVTVYQGAEDHDMAVKDEEAQGWVFFKSGSAGVVPFAVIQPRLVPWSWKLNPHGTHISTVGAIQIQTGRVIVPAETFYGPGDTAGLHPQHSNQYTWTWQSGQMIPPPDVFCGNAFCQP